MDDAQAVPARSGALAAAEDWFVKLNQWVVIALMATMALLVFVNVVSRYVFNYSIIWVEELTQYQMIWIAYLGAGLALREGRHVAVDTLQDLLPARLRRFVRLAIWFAIAVFLVTLTILGFQIAAFTWNQETPVHEHPHRHPLPGDPDRRRGVPAACILLHGATSSQRRFEHWEDPAAEELR